MDASADPQQVYLEKVLDLAAEAICTACGRQWSPQGDPEMYMYYRRAAKRAMNALALSVEERSFYDHAEPYSTGYEYRLATPFLVGDA